jgi:phosphatidate cytidylyltransferase
VSAMDSLQTLWALPLARVFAGVFAVLAAATVAGRIVLRSATTDSGRALGVNLVERINSWWWMIGLMAIAFLMGPAALTALFALLSFCAFREFISLTPTRRGDHRPLAVAFFILLPAQYLLIACDWYGLFSIFLPVFGFALMAILASIEEDTTFFVERCAKIQWGQIVCVFMLSHAPGLMLLEIPGGARAGMSLLFWLVIVAQSSDVLQYVVGKLFGKTKLSPVVSPSKTLEGLVGGGFLSSLLAMALSHLTPFSALQAWALGGIVVLCGFLGGYILSAAKRGLGAKDWGHLIEGHGGVLDRVDSLCFSAPILFHLTRYFF